MLFPALNKRQLKTSIVISYDKIFLVLKFSQSRRKFLKNQRTFYAQVFTGEISLTETLEQLRNWLEGITEDYILEKLEDSPNKYRPVFNITPRIKLDFNTTEEDVITSLQSYP